MPSGASLEEAVQGAKAVRAMGDVSGVPSLHVAREPAVEGLSVVEAGERVLGCLEQGEVGAGVTRP